MTHSHYFSKRTRGTDTFDDDYGWINVRLIRLCHWFEGETFRTCSQGRQLVCILSPCYAQILNLTIPERMCHVARRLSIYFKYHPGFTVYEQNYCYSFAFTRKTINFEFVRCKVTLLQMRAGEETSQKISE